jgi:hypothetical protein
MSFLACFHDYRRYLAPGERATVLIIATNSKQARVIFRDVRALLTRIPVLAKMIERETADTFDLNNGTTVEVHPVSMRTTRAVGCLPQTPRQGQRPGAGVEGCDAPHESDGRAAGD